MVNDQAIPKGQQRPDTVASLIRHLKSVLPTTETISVEEFLSLVGVHGFIFFLLVLAVLNLVIFMLPGVSIVFGVPMTIFAVQMLLGIKVPIFPKWICRKKISVRVLNTGLPKASEFVEVIERYIRPRWLFLTQGPMRRMHALLALVLALMVAVPVPLLNIPPTLGIIFLATGLMQRDGVFVAIAFCFALWSFRLYATLGVVAQNLLG
ncbi:MAG: exopolysaccharide biosynthesis protein [Proteobacteria bacterium]|jgi:hypothetical protein|nr:exopolysaccharide biosynthesis protein [Alphaproteobacteria bacterium]NCC02746.1 exopolysaccharide biosynthesis protein [Pseudomonadota bacterium]